MDTIPTLFRFAAAVIFVGPAVYAVTRYAIESKDWDHQVVSFGALIVMLWFAFQFVVTGESGDYEVTR